MKRSQPLRRATQLRRGRPLRSSGISLARNGIKRAVTPRLSASRRVLDHVRELVYLRDACRCVWCGVPGQTTLHHRVPRGMGGSSRNPEIHSAANLLVVCEDDHANIESRRSQAREVLGYLVPRGTDPATVPVYTKRLGWVLLDNEGGWTPCTEGADRP